MVHYDRQIGEWVGGWMDETSYVGAAQAKRTNACKLIDRAHWPGCDAMRCGCNVV